MIRVLHVIGKMDRAGAETMIMNIYRNIDRSRVQFDFLVFSDEEADYDKEIESLGGRIYRMPVFKGYNYLSLYRRFQKFFKERPYQIVHGHIGILSQAYLKCAKKAGAYTIAHSHGPISDITKERIIYKVLTYKVPGIADYFFGCSEEAGIERFGKKVVNSSKFKMIRNAIEGEKFIYTKERQIGLKQKFGLENKVVLGHVGRFIETKNHVFIVEIFEKLCEFNSDFALVLVGNGEKESQIKAIVSEKGLTEKVYFMGVRNDIPDMMNLFDAFVFPSFYEGLAVASVEAQAAGLPCFFSDRITEDSLITPNAWRYPLEIGAEQWSENILQILGKFERQNTYQEIVESGFDVVYSAKEIEEFYIAHSV